MCTNKIVQKNVFLSFHLDIGRSERSFQSKIMTGSKVGRMCLKSGILFVSSPGRYVSECYVPHNKSQIIQGKVVFSSFGKGIIYLQAKMKICFK